jgi:hypothetical protein
MHRKLIYMGWLGHRNYGDDLLLAAWEQALDYRFSVVAPLNVRQYARNAPSFVRDRAQLMCSPTAILVGGGTCLGFRTWAEHVRLAQRMYRPEVTFLSGAGSAAAGDAYARDLQTVEWERWRRLSSIRLLGVRGPLTGLEVAEHWRASEVVGDPALMYQVERDHESEADSGRLGICLGSQTGTRFNVDLIGKSVGELRKQSGLDSVVVLQASESDGEVARRLLEVVPGATYIGYDGDVERFTRAIASCDMVLSERLHGSIAAAANGVATLPLAYATKCDDFWASVTGQPAPVHPASSMREVLDACTVAAASVASISLRVMELRQKLIGTVEEIQRWLIGEDMIHASHIGNR